MCWRKERDDVFGIDALRLTAEEVYGERDNLVIRKRKRLRSRHFNQRIFFRSLSTTLNSGSPVTSSAFLILAKAAAKQSA